MDELFIFAAFLHGDAAAAAAQMAPEECCSGTFWWWGVHRVTTENASVLTVGGSLNCQLLMTPRHWPEKVKGKGTWWESQRSRAPLGTCWMTVKKVGRFMPGLVTVSAWFECEKPGGRCLLLTFHHQVYRWHHHHLFLLKPPSAITPKSSAIISETDDLCWPLMCARIHPPSTAVAFPLFCCKICNEKLYSTRQLSWYYILRSLFLFNHRAYYDMQDSCGRLRCTQRTHSDPKRWGKNQQHKAKIIFTYIWTSLFLSNSWEQIKTKWLGKISLIENDLKYPKEWKTIT